MLCNKCGKEVDQNSRFCPNCGGEISNVNNVGNINNNSNEQINKEGKVNVGLAILSFIIPIAGLIIFLVKKDSDKKNAKACGICALVSFVLGIIISIITVVLTFNLFSDFGNKVTENINNSNSVVEKDDTKQDDNKSDSNVSISNNWSDYEFTVNGKSIKLPCTYNELKEVTGFSMKSAQESSSLSNNYYTLVNMYKNDKLALSTEILNDTGSDIKYTDGKITRVSQSKYQVSTGADKITFPGDIKAGDEITEEKIKQLFGEPTDIYEYSNDGYDSVTYTYNEDTTWTTTNFYEIKIVNGVIDEITLDNRNYE